MSSVSVNTNNTQSATVGTEHTLATITTPGVFQLFIDMSNLVDGVTADELVISEYMKPASGGVEQLVKQWSFIGKQPEAMFISPPRMSAISIKYTLKQTAGTTRNFAWSVQQA